MSWQDKAICTSLDVQDFMIADKDDPEVEGLKGPLSVYNREKMAKAKEACDLCPVRAECVESAEPMDLFWSMRGGLMPTFMEKTALSKSPTFRANNYLPDVCSRNHQAWAERKDGGGRYCLDCNNKKKKSDGFDHWEW